MFGGGKFLKSVIEKTNSASSPSEALNLVRDELKKSDPSNWLDELPQTAKNAVASSNPLHGAGMIVAMSSAAEKLSSKNSDESSMQEFPGLYPFVEAAEILLVELSRESVSAYPGGFVQMCSAYSELCLIHHKPLASVHPLRSAISKIQADDQQITSVHSFFLRACIASKCYKFAQPYVMADLHKLDPFQVRLDTMSLLSYFYYSSIVCIALKNFTRALHFLKLVFVVPEDAISVIVIEAFKRYVLVSLLVHGEFADELPPFMSPSTHRMLKVSSLAYVRFAESFKVEEKPDTKDKVVVPPLSEQMEDQENLQAQQQEQAFGRHFGSEQKSKTLKVLKECFPIFVKDNLLGLVKQCLSHTIQVKIQRLTDTYLTYSLEDITKSVGLDSVSYAEKWILLMVEQGKVHAKIDQSKQMVSFIDDDDDNADTLEDLIEFEKRVKTVQILGNKLLELHKQIQLDPEHVKRVLSAEAGEAEAKSKWEQNTGTGDSDGDVPNSVEMSGK
eukprot:c20146_g2_i1.p1 GENE.c20146_g2_i1~~c20146_g2_i1.p1  ORF type:complete len:502 (+),score=211.69 c20146_g2_i1:1260-2765(+)